MSKIDPLQTSQEIKIAWINLADNYKSIGQNERAYELLKDLFQSQETSPIHVLKEKYLKHLHEWQQYNYLRQSIA